MPKVSLPILNDAAIAHSLQLSTLIADKIATQGVMTFAEFMHHALYTPQLGYYNSPQDKFGKFGDFITAPELSPIFSYAMAVQCSEILKLIPAGSILEFGAGSGKLAIGLLDQLEQLNCLPEEYLILEVSPYLKELQQQALAQELPHLINRVRWISTLPHEKFCGIIIANEVLDAMPVQRFRINNDSVEEAYVRHNQGIFEEYYQTSHDPQLQQLRHEIVIDEPYTSEFNLSLAAWINSVYDILQQGILLIIDYGFPRHEFYHPQRDGGTLMCHYQHLAHSNPFIYTGLQDISAHVDFTHVAQSALSAGWEIAGYTNQASFLLANNLLEYASNLTLDSKSSLQLKSAIKLLTLPQEMGELFKVIALSKQFNEPLRGFTLLDQRHRL